MIIFVGEKPLTEPNEKMKFRILLPLLFGGLFAVRAVASAAPVSEGDPLPLVPYPARIELGGDDFRFDARTPVKVSSGEAEDFFAASTLLDELAELYGLPMEVKKSRSGVRRCVTLTRPGCNPQADERLRAAGLDIGDGFDPEGYVLLADAQGVIVSAPTAAGVFYGVQTLRQLVRASDGLCRVPAVRIEDVPAMRYRWQQDDWSRGPIPSLEYAKEQVRILSEYKINGYSIYAENIYESKLHPAINPYGGTITAEEIAELIEYARRYHVEIIPQQQTFGHLHYVLRQERYAALGEKHGSQILSPAEEGSYAFVSDYLGEIVPRFDSEFIHIGCDETFELGRGKSRDAVAESSHTDVYLGHLRRVAALPELEGKKLLFWGEIAAEHPEKLDLLPENVIAVAWDYLPRDDFDKFIRPYADRNFPVFVAPGAFYGGRVFPDYHAHLANIRNFVRDGQKYGALGMLDTSWDDMGEDLFDMGWYGAVFAAACAWQRGESDIERYRNAFDWAFYRAPGHAFAEGIVALSDVHREMGPVSFDMAYSSPFSEVGAAQQNRLQNAPSRRMRLLCEEAYTQFCRGEEKALLHRQTIPALRFAARRMDFVFHKAVLASEMSDLYDAFVRDDDKGYAVNTALYDLIMPYASRLGSLRDMTKELKAFHRDLWRYENRPFHWEVVGARYDRMLLEWEMQNDRISLDLQQFGRTGTHLPREEAGFRFDRPAAQ